ncbi:EamA family transporter [Marinobacter sp.]|uniref:EamA family transporter n=1 Tax=Marinobacter sp. TaxID=50741 RepID=UPI001B4100E0|nr:EamA family transporter [Marinobacter sp.]
MALNYTSMANAVMLLYLAPVTASAVAHFFMGERLSGLSVALIGVALFGFAMMMEFDFNLTGRKEESIDSRAGTCADPKWISNARWGPVRVALYAATR